MGCCWTQFIVRVFFLVSLLLGFSKASGFGVEDFDWCCTCVCGGERFWYALLCFENFVLFRLSVMLIILLQCVQSANAICRLLQACVI